MIEVRNAFKHYGEQVILEKLNITIQSGEFITMVGASGCGKSTFLKMILGTEKPSKGEVILNGNPIPNEPSSDVGVVFQQYSVFSHLTVLDNLLIVGRFKRNKTLGFFSRQSKRAFTEKTSLLLQKVGLKQVLNKYPHELSGGMRQRLAIAQALLGEPKILLLDEPFGALDPGTRNDMHKLVLELWRELGITVLMVTHDLKEGFYLGTRLWVFDKANHHNIDKHQGSTITYDLPIGNASPELYQELDDKIQPVETLTRLENVR